MWCIPLLRRRTEPSSLVAVFVACSAVSQRGQSPDEWPDTDTPQRLFRADGQDCARHPLPFLFMQTELKVEAQVRPKWGKNRREDNPSLNFSVPVARTSQPFFNVHPYNPVINPCLQQDSLNVKSTQIERQQTIHVVCTDRWVKMQRSEVARGINYVLLSDTAAKAVDGSTVFFGNIFSMVYSPVTIWYTAVKYLHAALRTRSST
jgi:hypothetical protein